MTDGKMSFVPNVGNQGVLHQYPAHLQQVCSYQQPSTCSIDQQPGVYGQPSGQIPVVYQPQDGERQDVGVAIPNQYIPDNMLLSLIALCFFCPLGVFAVVYSNDASEAKRHQDFDHARTASKKAKVCAVISISIGFMINLSLFIIVALLVLAVVEDDRQVLGKIRSLFYED